MRSVPKCKETFTKRSALDVKKGEKMDWTNEQKQAIYEKGNNILVAAAAR